MRLNSTEVERQGRLLQKSVKALSRNTYSSDENLDEVSLQEKLEELEQVKAKEGDGSALQSIVNYRKSKLGPTTLHLISQNSEFIGSKLVKKLVQLGADPNAIANMDKPRRRGAPYKLYAPLHVATYYGSLDVVSYLLEAGANPNKRDGLGKAPLHYFLGGEFSSWNPKEWQLYDLFQQYQADFWLLDENGKTPVELAIERGNLDFVQWIFDPENSSQWLANRVAQEVLPVYIMDLIYTEYDSKIRGLVSYISRELDNGNKAASDAVAQIKSYTDEEGWGILHRVVDNGNDDITSLLLEWNFDVNASEITTKDYQGMPPLHLAARFPDRDVVEQLLKHGADPNQKDDKGQTALDICHRFDISSVKEPIVAAGGKFVTAAKKLVPDLKRALRDVNRVDVELLLKEGVSFTSFTKKELAHVTKNLQSQAINLATNGSWNLFIIFIGMLQIIRRSDGSDKLVRDVVNAVDKNGVAVFALCLKNRVSLPVAQALLDLGVDLKWKDKDGQNYAFYVFDIASTDGERLASFFSKAGVDLNQPRSDGHTVASLQLMSHGVVVGDVCNKLGARFPKSQAARGSIARHLNELFLKSLLGDLVGVSDLQDIEQAFSDYLTSLEDVRDLVGDDIFKRVVNPDQGDSPLALCVKTFLPIDFLDQLVSLSKNPNYQRLPGSDGPIRNKRSPLKGAFFLGRKLEIPKLVELGADPNWQDANGQSHLIRLATTLEGSELDREILKLCLALGVGLNLTDSQGNSALYYFLEKGNFENVLFLQEHGALIYPKRPGMTIEVYVDGTTERLTEKLSVDQVLKTTLKKLLTLPTRIQKEAEHLYKISRSIKQLYHYVQSCDEVSSVSVRSDGKEFNQLVPNILFTYGVRSVEGLLKHVQHTIKKDWPYAGYYPLEAELLLLLNQPGESSPNIRNVEVVVACLDATRKSQRKLTARSLTNLARIGSLTFSFPFWRYDAMSIREKQTDGSVKTLAPSLLEQYGFERIPDRSTDWKLLPGDKRQHLYGPGFVLPESQRDFEYQGITYSTRNKSYTFSKQTHLEFRRAYLMVSNPDHGTLIIRNSSHKFGRDALAHTAYYSKHAVGKGFTEEDLYDFSPVLLEQAFTDLLSSYDQASTVNAHDRHLGFLLRELVAGKDVYRRWKFDTSLRTAWQDVLGTGKKNLIGGHYSSGFRSFVSLAKYVSDYQYELDSEIQYPFLGFVNPDFPMWKTYSYTDGEGHSLAKLTLDSETVAVLEKLAHYTVTDEELDSTGIRNFFAQAGFQNEAELVLISND